VPLASLHAGCWLPDVRPVDSVAHVRAPLLILHPREDEMIPTEQAHKLYEHAHEPRQLWIVPTDGHGSALGAWHEYVWHVQRLVDPWEPRDPWFRGW
jgi:fermentation-respiration switch protein FrsA (DUF1100 family)